MVYEIDARTSASLPPGLGEIDGVAPKRRDELAAAAAAASRVLPGDHEIRVASVDAESGGAAVLISDGAQAIDGDYVARALRHLQSVGLALGLETGQPPEFVADPGYQVTSAGGVAVHLRQLLTGSRSTTRPRRSASMPTADSSRSQDARTPPRVRSSRPQ